MSERIYRWLLRLYPRALRQQYGEAMVEAFRDRRAALRRRYRLTSAARLLLFVGADLLRSVPREQGSEKRRSLTAAPRPRKPRRRSGSFIERLGHDLSAALRTVRRAPAFAALVVVTMALGIGAATVIFSIVEAVLLRPMPYAEPQRLVWLQSYSVSGERDRGSNLLDFWDWQANSAGLSDMAGYWDTLFTLSSTDAAERIFGAAVTSEYFSVLGVAPARGRDFRAEETTWGEHRVVILRDSFWRARFGADPDIVGRTVRINGEPFDVIGVMPEGWPGGWSSVQIWVPMAFEPGTWWVADRGSRWMDGAVARLAPGAGIEQADDEIEAVSATLANEYPDSNADTRVRAELLEESVREGSRPALVSLMGAVGLMLAIACANVANLLLARSSARQRETNVRAALGASRGRIMQQALIESLVLALLGGAGGLLLATVALRPAVALAANRIAGLGDVGLSVGVLAFGAGLSIITALAFGMVPAARVARSSPHNALGGGGRTASGSKRTRATMRALMVAEIALSVVLLVGAGLLARSFVSLRTLDPGFEPNGVLTMRMELLGSDYPTSEEALRFYEQVTDRLEQLPGVESVATSPYEMPLGRSEWRIGYGAEGQPVPANRSEYADVRYAIVSPAYFETLRIPVLRGRAFHEADSTGSAPVAILNQSAARQLFNDAEPLGAGVWLFAPDDTVVSVVGVVGDVRIDTLRSAPTPTVFVPSAQASKGLPRAHAIMLRTGVEPASVAAAARAAVAALDPDQPLERVATLDEVMSSSLGEERFNSVLVGVFSLVALALSALGIYGVISFSVSRQVRDIGVFLALGARHRDVVRLVLRQVLTVVAIGVAIGVLAALGLAPLLSGMLYGVGPSDPWTLAAVVATLFVVALLACAIPTRRALAIEPTQAMRAE